MEEERPVHLVVDCSTNEATEVPLTDEEWEEHKQRSQEHAEYTVLQAEKRRQNQEAARNHPDPLVRAMAEELGWI